MANWADRILAVVNTFIGRPSPTDTSAAFQVRAPLVNQNFQGSLLAMAFCQALGTECTDNTSTNILCKLKLVAGRFTPGDRVTVIEDRPTGRVWCALVTGTGAVPVVEFADAQLQDATLAGTADYDTIQADLLIVATAPLDSFIWPKQAILVGGEHGLSGTVIPWQDGNTQTIETKLLAAVGPAGNDTEFQFNDAGDFGGAEHLKYDKTLGSTMLGGEALALRTGELVQSGGAIAAAGDNQKGDIEGGVQTTDAALTPVLTLAVPSGKSIGFEGQIIGRNVATGDSSFWTFEGAIKNVGGTTGLVGGAVTIAPTLIVQDVGAAGWAAGVGPDDVTDVLSVRVQGDLATTIDWACSIRWTEVA